MFRLFTALELPESFKRALDRPRSGLEGARWQRDDQLHVTIAFIGEVSVHQADEIAAAFAQIDIPAFDWGLSGVGYFGKLNRPRAIWAGVEADRALALLYEKQCRVLSRLGLAVEKRAFRPHVTLARFNAARRRGIASWLEANAGLASERVHCTSFALIRSRLGHEGAHYQVEARFPDHYIGADTRL